MTDNKKQRLVSYVSGAGIASRRKAFDLIMSGRITVNGNVIREPSSFITPGDVVRYDGSEIKPADYMYIMLNKPRGYTCTSDDPHADKKAVDLIRIDRVRLFSIGRLDRDSEGLILFTNDGLFADRIAHPKNRILKTYEVELDGEPGTGDIARMLKGVMDEGETLRAVSVEKIKTKTYLFTLGEGRKREVRRLAKSAGLRVLRLKRISVGELKLGDLPSGKWRKLSEEEIGLINLPIKS